jgi:hypothetical protein
MVFMSTGSSVTIDKCTETIKWGTLLKESIIPFSAVKSVTISRRITQGEWGEEHYTPYVLSIGTTEKEIVIDKADKMAGAAKICGLASDIGMLIGKPVIDR